MRLILRKSELTMSLSVSQLTLPCVSTPFRAFRHTAPATIAALAAAGILMPLAYAQPAAPLLHHATGSSSAARAAVEKQPAAQSPVLLDAMTSELHRAFTALSKQSDEKQVPPYFLSYSVADADQVSIRAQYGALVDSSANRQRVADIQVRLGDPKLDNTHGSHRGSAVNSLELPLVDDRQALTRTLWLATNTGYSNALDNYLRVKTEAQVRAKEEDDSPDFSKEAPQVSIVKP